MTSDTSAVWLGLTQEALDAAYDQAVHAPNMTEVLARLAQTSRLVRDDLGGAAHHHYGEGDDESLDLYRAEGQDRPVLIFVHGGSWRVGTAADNAFAARTFVNAGIHFVVPDFSPVDAFGGDLSGMVDQLHRAVAWVHSHAGEFGGDPDRLYLAGFSSGAHLAGVLLTSDRQAMGLPPDVFKGALLCSGMYDLTPVALSFRREFLKLDAAATAALSPQRHCDRITAPLVVACGTDESPEFLRQARDFAGQVDAAGKAVRLLVLPGYNHFEIIESLADSGSPLSREVLQLMV